MQLWPLRRRRSSNREASDVARGSLQEVLVVCHDDDGPGMEIMENLCAGLEFSRIRFAVLDIKKRTAWPDLRAFASIVICTEMLWELGPEKSAALGRYVEAGGGMLVAYRSWNPVLSKILGFAGDAAEPAIHLSSGLSFIGEIVTGVAGLEIDSSDRVFRHSRFDVASEGLTPDCRIFGADGMGRPIGWSRTHGGGRIVYWNTGVLYSRALRGFAVQSVLATMTVGVAAIAGFAMLHVDDFPTALSEARLEPVSTEFPDLDWNGFLFDVWHSDMMALKAKHGLRYSWYAIMDYEDADTSAGAVLSEAAAASGRAILESRFRRIAHMAADDDEFGFHGYNHVPLVDTAWPDLETLKSKLGLARELWESVVPGPTPTSWVPANNWYHADHLRVLRQVFPEISTVSSVFSGGDREMGEFREFGPEPWNDAFLCLPRETYGYVLDPGLRMMMLSQIAGMGVWTHFVHPDDVYDIPASPDDAVARRNARSLFWRAENSDGHPGLYSHLDEWLTMVRSLFPWLEFVTTSQAAAKYRAHVDNRVDVVSHGDSIEIRSGAESLYYVRTREGVTLAPACNCEAVDRRDLDGGVMHVVKCAPGHAILHLRDA